GGGDGGGSGWGGGGGAVQLRGVVAARHVAGRAVGRAPRRSRRAADRVRRVDCRIVEGLQVGVTQSLIASSALTPARIDVSQIVALSAIAAAKQAAMSAPCAGVGGRPRTGR